MSVVGLVLAGGVAVLAAACVVLLVATSSTERDDAIRHALVVHGVAWLLFVVLALVEDPLDLPAVVEIPVGVMAVAWGVAWVVLGRSYAVGVSSAATRAPIVTRRRAPTQRPERPRTPH
jgi:UDP-N-acetylmuramyl pentapeptide phosphotransferase/UDP-N-acetylglucosamine-1-phosphate transferase